VKYFPRVLPVCRKTEIENGTRVVTLSIPDRDSVAASIWIRAGSRFEPESLSGVSHFLEHMVFKGTRKRSAQRIKETVEGTGGQLNAFTGEESTCFFARVLKPYFPQTLEVLADMVQNAVLDPAEIKREKAVILEEIKMYRDIAAQHVEDMMGEMLWPRHALGRPVSGTQASVRRLGRKELAAYRDQYYHGSNCVVAVAGPVQHEAVVRRVRSLFKGQKKMPESSFDPAGKAPAHPRARFLAKKTGQTHFVIGLHAFSRYDRRRYGLALLSLILGGNMSSRLFEKIREQKGLAYDIRSTSSFYQDTGALLISAGVESSRSRDVIRLILKELDTLTREKVSEGEFRRAKDHFLGQFYMSLEDHLDYLLWAGEHLLYRPELPKPESLRKGIEAVTLSEIRDIARELFDPRRFHLALIGPENARQRDELKKLIKI